MSLDECRTAIETEILTTVYMPLEWVRHLIIHLEMVLLMSLLLLLIMMRTVHLLHLVRLLHLLDL